MIYFFSIAITVLIGTSIPHPICRVKKKKCLYFADLKRYLLIFLAVLGPLLVSALRYGIGTDYFFTYIPQLM